MYDSLAKPLSDIVGSSSPVQKAIKIVNSLVEVKPSTIINTVESNSSSYLILNHLMGLMYCSGLVNNMGYHSSAVTLLRAIEDSTDCFAAVSLNQDAAKDWMDGKLKASKAAQIWISSGKIQMENGELSQYRKNIRSGLNNYSHCTPEQTHWNIYLKKCAENKCTMEINTKPEVIKINAYYIDRYLCAHLYELIEIIKVVYVDYFNKHKEIYVELDKLHKEIQLIVEEFLRDIGSDSLAMDCAPEINRIKSNNKSRE